MDINKLDKQKMQAMMLSKGMYAGDDSLWDHVSPETRKLVEQFCDKYQLPAGRFAKLRPWVVAFAAADIAMIKAGMDPSLGIDKHFLDKAAQGGEKKTVVEIESAEWQLNLLSGFSEEFQGKLLASALDLSNKSLDIKKMEDLWKSGDLAGVEAISKEEALPPEIEKAIVHDRNPHMADVAEQYLKGKDQAFLVVGAGHMVGEDGVVSLLEKRGYKIQQVALADTEARASGSVEDDVMKTDEAYRLAKLHRDTQALDRILADEFYETNQYGRGRNKAQSLELWRTFSIGSLTTDTFQVRLAGDTATVFGTQTENGTERMIFARVYVKRSNAWQLLASMQFRDPNPGRP